LAAADKAQPGFAAPCITQQATSTDVCLTHYFLAGNQPKEKNMKIAKQIFASLVFAVLACNAHAGVFDGTQLIEYEFFAPNLSTPVATAPNGFYIIPPGGITIPNMGGEGHGFSLTIQGDFLTINNTLNYTGFFQSASFFGFVITDPVVTFTSLSVANNTLLGASPALSFDANDLYVNMQGLSITPGSLQLQVAAVPEPETYALMLAGLGLLGLFARRRKQRAA
jgi:hypothetical protein